MTYTLYFTSSQNLRTFRVFQLKYTLHVHVYTFSNTCVNNATIDGVTDVIYSFPMFFTIESIKYRAGSFLSIVTCKNAKLLVLLLKHVFKKIQRIHLVIEIMLGWEMANSKIDIACCELEDALDNPEGISAFCPNIFMLCFKKNPVGTKFLLYRIVKLPLEFNEVQIKGYLSQIQWHMRIQYLGEMEYY